MATKAELEFEAEARRKEAARKAKAGPVRITVPTDAPGPRTAVRNPLAGSARVGGFSAQDAADIGGVIARPRTKPGITPTPPPPGQLDPAVTGVTATPLTTPVAPKEEAPIDPASPEALRTSFLGQQGVSPEIQAQDPRVFNAQGSGRFQRRQRIGAGGQDFVNLGAFETEGGPNIFGRASEEGGPINTFVGAGAQGPGGPAQDITPQLDPEGGGRFAEGFRSTAVDPTLQRDIDAFQLRAASGGSLRAGSKGFRGGAASGGGNDTLRQVNRINSRADKAFQEAIAQGMNTKAAARIAGSIRDSASQINFQDRTAAGERNAALAAQTSERTAALREQGALTKLGAEQQQAEGDAFIENLRNLHGTVDEDTGEFTQDPQSFSRAIFAAGGERAVRGLSQSAGFAAFQQGSNVAQILAGVNEVVAKNGKRFDNIQDLLDGGNARLAQTGATILDALKDDTIDITDIFSQKITLGDGTNIELGDFFGDATLTNRERAALIEIIGQKKKDK